MIRFAVLGDIHYTVERLHGHELEHGTWGRADLLRYAAARRDYYDVLAEEVRGSRPDFVVQVGDLLTGHWDAPEEAAEELREALAWLDTCGAPVYPVRGNHDDSGPAADACNAVLSPHLDRLPRIGREGYSYEFSAGGARFVFVDCRESYTRPATQSWLRDLRSRLVPGERLFLFAHEPLYAVARPYFSAPAYVEAVREAVRDCPLDALFCGHAHNQAWTYHPDLGTSGALQIKGCVVGERGLEPRPLDQMRTLLIAPPAQFLGGYLEDTLPSWTLVEANSGGVRLTWNRIGGGVEGVLQWYRPAGTSATIEPHWAAAPPDRPLAAIRDAELASLRAARINMAFHGSDRAGKPVLLNGVPVGAAPTTGYFGPRVWLALQPEHLELIGRTNAVALQSFADERVCWGGVTFEVETADGRVVRSDCGGPVFDTGFGSPEQMSAAGIERRAPGDLLGPATVRFR